MNITLLRLEQTENETLGILLIAGKATNYKTLELPYLTNQRNISCVPTGKYTLMSILSPKFSYCYELLSVNNRDDILIHNGNTNKDTEGCILIGDTFGQINKINAVYNSVNSLQCFNNILKKVSFKEQITLDIKSCICCI